jgi:peptidase E
MKPLYLLAGGHGPARRGPDPLLQEVFSQIEGKAPSIAYVGAASEDDRDFLKWISALFLKAGAGRVRLAPAASPGADRDEARRVLSESDLVFISGGDVEAGMRVLKSSGLTPVLKRLQKEGKPFFGLSAGSIMLARSWVRWSDPEDDTTAEKFACLNLAPVFCDTHAEEEDWEELKILLGLGHTARAIGYGIPSGGALRITPGGTVSALGKPAARFQYQAGVIVPLPPLGFS